MKVTELLLHLQNYAAQSPENGHAVVKMALADGKGYDVAAGNDSRGFANEHYLVLVPDINSGIGMHVVRKM